jgi:hypothetical protein
MTRPFLTTFRPHLQLPQKESGLEFGHAVIGTEHFALVLVGNAGPPAIDDRLQGFVTIQSVGENYPTLACCHQFAFLETETAGVPGSTCASALKLAAMRVGTIFNDLQIVLASDGQQCVHVGKSQRKVNRHEGASSWSDSCAHCFWIEAIGVWIDVRKHRHTSRLEHRDRGAVPGICGHNNFVSELKVQRLNGRKESDGAVGKAKAVLGPVKFGKPIGKFTSESAGNWKTTPMPALNYTDNPSYIGGLILRPRCEWSFADWSAAEDSQSGHFVYC